MNKNIPPVVKNLLIINVLFFVATFVLGKKDIDLNNILGMHYWNSEYFNPAQLISYMFMHADIMHIFFNMFALYMFGGVMEEMWGPKRFLFYYIVTGIGAGLIQQLVWTIEYQPLISALNEAATSGSADTLLPYRDKLIRIFPKMKNIDFSFLNAEYFAKMQSVFLNSLVTIGASGSIFGLLLAFGWLFPEAKLMLIFLPIPIKARLFVLLYCIAELFLGVANFSSDNVAHFAHLGGIIFGVFIILYWKKKGILYINNKRTN